MTWRISILFIILCLISCKDSKEKESMVEDEHNLINTNYYSTKHLIECEDLNSDSNIKIIDFRKPKAFLKSHIANAINIWRTDIEDASYPYKGIMASKTQIENLFSRLGIKNEDTLIIYDDSGACDASRLWWVLKNYGFDNVKILNGGLTEWKNRKGELVSKVIEFAPSQFKFQNSNNKPLYIGLDAMKSIVNSDSNRIILDTRTDDEFSGKRQKNGAFRGGHIPNSILIDWSRSVDYQKSKKFKSYPELLELYQQFGVTKDKSIYVYCHSGVRSAHTTFVLTELLGFKKVKNYDGSWVEWSYFKDLPIENTSLTTILK